MFAENSESASKDDIVKISQDDETKTWQNVEIKVESDQSEIKEPKDETGTETNADADVDADAEHATVPESKMIDNHMIMDVDKFEPIESDEDDEMCDRLEIKTEVEDSQSQDKSLESETYKQESISEDSKSQDIVDNNQSSINENKLNSGDNEPFKKRDHSLLSNILPKNEIEDIQQKLHSFHSENLMILQTRNKKRASRATTPTSDEITNINMTSKDSVSSTSSIELSSNSRKFSVDEHEIKNEPPMKNEEDTSMYNQYQPAPVLPSNSASINQPITPNYSPYTMNTSQIYQTTPAPSYSTPPPNANIPPSSSLYHYLDNPNRSTGYNAPHLFTMNTSVPPPTLLNSSTYLTKSYSTLSEPSTPVTNVPPSPVGVTPSSSSNPINPKVLSRTQSADPRLNPPKDLPMITPKRKLSINEYRKRKQLTTTVEKPKVETDEKVEITDEPIKMPAAEEKPKNGMAVADTTKETGKIDTFLNRFEHSNHTFY